MYIEQNWIKSQLWPPKNWTVFNKKIRTNNDCEGLHHLWNLIFCQNSISFYCLLCKLYLVCIGVPLQVTLIANNKLKRKQKSVDVKRNENSKGWSPDSSRWRVCWCSDGEIRKVGDALMKWWRCLVGGGYVGVVL